jgi:hypothetical protein
VSGDFVYFKKGDVFYLSNYTGNKPLPTKNGVTYTAYGSGAAPVFSGFKIFAGNAANWQTYSSSIKYLDATALPLDSLSYSQTNRSVRIVLVKKSGVDSFAKQTMGRTPNSGYFTATTATSATQLTSTGLVGATSYANHEMVLRTSDWSWDRLTVKTHNTSTGTITFPAAQYAPNTDGGIWENGWGFFFQNHVSTLDQTGEWCYDRSSRRMYIYGLASGDTVKVSAVQRCLDLTGKLQVTLEGLDFEGAYDVVANVRNARPFGVVPSLGAKRTWPDPKAKT